MLAEGGQHLGLQKTVAGLAVHVEADDEGARQDLGQLATQGLDAGGVEQALGALHDGLGVGAALALLLGDAGDAGEHEGGQVLGHLLDLDVVQHEQRVLRAVGVVGRVGALLLLGLAEEQGRDELAGRGLARAGHALEAGHGLGADEVEQQEAGQPGEHDDAVRRRAGEVLEQQVGQQAVGFVRVGVRQVVDGLHLARAVQDHAVGVAAVFEDLHPLGRDLGDLVLGVVEVEVDGVAGHVAVQPGEVLAHLAPLHRQVGQHLVEGAAAASGLDHAGVLVEAGVVQPTPGPVRAVHPEQGVLEEHERLARRRAKEHGAVFPQPLEGGLGHAGVVWRARRLLGLQHDLLDAGPAGAGGRARQPALAAALLPGAALLHLLRGLDLLAQHTEGGAALAQAGLDLLEVAALLQGLKASHLPEHRGQQPVDHLFGGVLGQARDAQLQGRAGLGQQGLEVGGGLA